MQPLEPDENENLNKNNFTKNLNSDRNKITEEELEKMMQILKNNYFIDERDQIEKESNQIEKERNQIKKESNQIKKESNKNEKKEKN